MLCVFFIAGLGLAACWKSPPRALYLALKFTYYEPTLEPVAALLAGERLAAVYPELGVFDPIRRGFTDFAGSLEVIPRGDAGERASGPLETALASAPARLQTAFGPTTRRVAWIFLNRLESPAPRGSGREAVATARRGRAGPRTAAGAMPDPASSPSFDPADPGHRQALVETVQTLQRYGFDGVQLDLEPFPTGDVPAVVTLLEALREALGDGFTLAVFTPKYTRPDFHQSHPGFVWHSAAPFQALLDHCDQLIVPLYDYGPLALNADRYQARVREVSEDLLRALRPSEKVWLSLPAYRNTPQHGQEETADNAIRALRQAGRSPGGVAWFVYTGDAQDFQPGSTGMP